MKKNILTWGMLAMMALSSATIKADTASDLLAMHKAGEVYETAFSRKEVMPKLDKENTSEGTLVYRNPGYLRLDFTNPAGDYQLIDEGIFDSYVGGKLQHIPFKNEKGQFAKLRHTLLYAFAGDVAKVAEINEAKMTCDKKGGKIIADMTEGKNRGRHLVLVYDAVSGNLLELTITEANGHSNTYSTKNK